MNVMAIALFATSPMPVMLTIFLVVSLCRAKKTKKNDAHYITCGFCCAMILVVMMALLAQYVLALSL
jgi:hypothetical protein